MSNLHAHIDTYAVDCDGPISNSYVMTMNDDEKASEFGDIEFHNRVVASVVNTYSIFQQGTLRVTSGEGADYVAMLEWSEQTEEGGRSTSAFICENDCDTGERSYRDHRAEDAGY